jgi:hypothetical protein
MLLVVCGLYAIVPARWYWMVLPGLATVFAVLDFYGVYALLVPYYTGMISHPGAGDFIRPATLMQLVNAGPHLLLERLSANKPACLTPSIIGFLFLAYCISTVIPAVVSYRAMKRDSGCATFQLAE